MWVLQSLWDGREQLKLTTSRDRMGLRNLETENLYLDVMDYMGEFKED